MLAGDVKGDAVGVLGDALGKYRVSGQDVFADHERQNTGGAMTVSRRRSTAGESVTLC
jgi:hypothetical protein